MLFDSAAHLQAEDSLFSILGGKSFRFEGIGGKPRLEAKGKSGTVIQLVEGPSSIAPDLTLQSLHLAIRIGGGAANMIDDGAVDYVSSVIVHANHVLGGGQRAPERTSYIFGILVYGNNVSIQGNVVRDFNRGEPVPGERVGHHFKLENGTWHRGPWVARDGNPRVRLAGAAIYAKARYGVISNNVCTNSGWTSVRHERRRAATSLSMRKK